MNNTAIIKTDGKAIKTVTEKYELSNLKFDIKGFLIEFTNDNTGIIYRYITRSDYNQRDENNGNASQTFNIGRYCDKNWFKSYKQEGLTYAQLKWRINENGNWKDNGLNDNWFDNQFEPAEINDYVEVEVVKFEPNYNTYFVNSRHKFQVLQDEDSNMLKLNYDINNDGKIDNLNDISIPPIVENPNDRLNNMPDGEFYTVNFVSNPTIQALSDTDERKEKIARLVTLIAFKVYGVYSEVLFNLNENEPNESIVRQLILGIESSWETGVLSDNATDADSILLELTEYRNALGNFYNALRYADFGQLNEYEKLRELFKIISISALGIIDISTRIEAINDNVNEDFDVEYILKILKSVQNNQSTEFFQNLSLYNYVSGNGNTTLDSLYSIIYRKCYSAFGLIGIGKEKWKTVMDEFYRIWLYSDFNPYDILGNLKDSYPPDNTFALQDDPILYTLNYQSSSTALIFQKTNFDFQFRQKFIDIYALDNGITYYIESIFNNTGPQGYLISSYNIFQPIVVQNSSENTNSIKFLQVRLEGQNANEFGGVIPLFYLKYIDDIKNVDNLETAAEVTFDVALTITGVGNLAKLRHLKHINKLGRVALGLEVAVPGQTLITYELAQGTAGLIEVSSSVASLWINHVNDYQNTSCNPVSPQYNEADCEWYKSFENWMLFLQIKSGVLDAVSSLAVKRGARALLTNPPSNFEPEALQILGRFADNNFTDLKNLFQLKLTDQTGILFQNVWDKLNDLPLSPINRQEEFILDFQGARKADLQILNENGGELVDYWNQIEHLRDSRRNVRFLEAYKYVNHPSVKRKLIEITEVNGKRVGGHVGSALFDDSKDLYAILDAEAIVIQKIKGNRIYKQVRKTSLTMKKSGSSDVRKKGWHTWIENITEQEFTEDIAYAFENKIKIKEELSNDGARRVSYKSRFKDGTKLTLITEDPYIIDELNDVFQNHLTSILLTPKF